MAFGEGKGTWRVRESCQGGGGRERREERAGPGGVGKWHTVVALARIGLLQESAAPGERGWGVGGGGTRRTLAPPPHCRSHSPSDDSSPLPSVHPHTPPPPHALQVLSDDPYTTDERTYHEAVEVIKGRKYAANFWIHMFEFQEALKRGCEKCRHPPGFVTTLRP